MSNQRIYACILFADLFLSEHGVGSYDPLLATGADILSVSYALNRNGVGDFDFRRRTQ